MNPYYLAVMADQRIRAVERQARLRRMVEEAKTLTESGPDGNLSGPGALAVEPSPELAGGTPPRTSLLLVGAALLTLYLVWGSTYLGIRIAIATLPPLLMAATRFLIAGVLLYAWSIRRGDVGADKPSLRHWRSALIIGGLLLAGGNGGVSWGEQFIPSSLAALLVATVPIWMVVIAHLSGDERISWRVAVGLGVGIIGVAVLMRPAGGQPQHLVGVLVVLAAALSWAGGSIYARRAPLPRRPLVTTSMEMLCGAAVLAVLSVFDGELGRVQLAHISLASAAALAYLVVFGSIVAFSSYVWLLKVSRASIVGTYAYVNPAVAVLLGWGLAGEALTPAVLLGGGIIIAAVVLIVSPRSLRLRRRQRQASPAPTPV